METEIHTMTKRQPTLKKKIAPEIASAKDEEKKIQPKSFTPPKEAKSVEPPDRFEEIDIAKKKLQSKSISQSSNKISSKRRNAVREAQEVLISLKTFIDNLKDIDEYDRKRPWADELFLDLTQLEWGNAREEVSEILYKWGRFLLDHGKFSEGIERFWELYEKFPDTRWHRQVFEELVALQKPENMVFIPKGKTTITENSKDFELAPYFLDIHLVTNAQYFEFVKDTGYPAPSHWIGEMYPIGKGNHPVVWVSAEDAIAYACWKEKRLPTEAEWENAAKGPECLLWPWGNGYESKRCNCREAGINDTTNVGQYEGGRSFHGCYDLAGNVWEWTESWYESSQSHRVLKGGSWFSFEEYTSTSYRYFDFPDSRKGIYGFRCCKTFERPVD